MGYGLLFFGYILAFLFNKFSVYFFADVIGSIIVIFALKKLMAYDKLFFYAVFPMLGFLIISFVNGLNVTFTIFEKESIIYYILMGLKAATVVLFHYFYLKGSFHISVRAELPKQAKRAKRLWFVTIVYVVLDFLLLAFNSEFGSSFQYISLLTLFFGLYWLLVNLILIYKLFSLACEEGDEEALPNKSKIGFINKLNEKTDKIIHKDKDKKDR